MKWVNTLSNLLGGGGVLLCLIAGVVRLTGAYHVMGFEALTLFVAGIALLVCGCFAKLFYLEQTLGRG